jgi:hypothetical protein
MTNFTPELKLLPLQVAVFTKIRHFYRQFLLSLQKEQFHRPFTNKKLTPFSPVPEPTVTAVPQKNPPPHPY